MAWWALSPTPPSPLPQHPESSLGVLLDTERCLPFVTKINDGIGFNKKATHVSNSQARQLPDTPPDSCCSPQVKGECPQPPALRAPFLFLNFGEKERPFSPVRSPLVHAARLWGLQLLFSTPLLHLAHCPSTRHRAGLKWATLALSTAALTTATQIPVTPRPPLTSPCPPTWG